MTAHLEQLHNRLKGSCPEISEKPILRSGVITTEKLFLVAQVHPSQFVNVQSFIKLAKPDNQRPPLLGEHFLSFLKELNKNKSGKLKKLDIIPKGYANFLTFFWCFRDWHKNKKFLYKQC